MPTAPMKLLIVDDEPSTRMLMSTIFGRMSLRVRTATDGPAALDAISFERPDIILSDLNMPGMSGFEFLAVVRRRFPAIYVIAMSGDFSGDGVAADAADAFYEKATGITTLLRIIGLATHSWLPEVAYPHLVRFHRDLDPVWIPATDQGSNGKPCVQLDCPDCLRSFPHELLPVIALMQQTACYFCKTAIHYAIVPATDPASPNVFQN